MQQDQFHFPDFTVPDFTQPILAHADLARPDFVLPDPARSELQQLQQMPLWPEDMGQAVMTEPDPALPALLGLDQPDTLGYPAEDMHALPVPENAPEVVMQDQPGELDPAALSVLLSGPDEASLPADLRYPQLYTNDEQMTWRKRHFAMLEPGLVDKTGDRYAD